MYEKWEDKRHVGLQSVHFYFLLTTAHRVIAGGGGFLPCCMALGAFSGVMRRVSVKLLASNVTVYWTNISVSGQSPRGRRHITSVSFTIFESSSPFVNTRRLQGDGRRLAARSNAGTT